MKRIIVGMLLAAVAWMIGTKIPFWPASWLGLVFGFASGLAFEDWNVTRTVVGKEWRKFVSWKTNYQYDWEGLFNYMFTSILVIMVIVGWVGSLLYLLLCLEVGYKGAQIFHLGLVWIYISLLMWFPLLFLSQTLEWIKDPRKIKEKCKEARILCLKWNPVCFCFWLPYAMVHYVIPYIFHSVIKIMIGTRIVCLGMKWLGQVLLYSLVELAAKEKALTFAVCVTMGAGVGILLGKTIACGLMASLFAGVLILVSDRTRELAKQKLMALKPPEAFS